MTVRELRAVLNARICVTYKDRTTNEIVTPWTPKERTAFLLRNVYLITKTDEGLEVYLY